MVDLARALQDLRAAMAALDDLRRSTDNYMQAGDLANERACADYEKKYGTPIPVKYRYGDPFRSLIDAQAAAIKALEAVVLALNDMRPVSGRVNQ